MGAAVRIMRAEHTAADLRALAAKSRDGAQVRRLLALALILEGQPRKSAAEQAGMDRQTLRDWVHRYNDAGVAGLASIRSGGRTALLTAEEMAALKELVIQGPDPETDKVVRWRCIDLREVVTRRFSVTVSERTIGKWLRQMELTRLQPRPFHPKKDELPSRLLKTYGPPRLQVLSAIPSEQSASTYPALGLCPGQDGDPRAPVLIKVPASSAIF
jgi:transposase